MPIRRTDRDYVAITLVLANLILILAGAYGWCANIFKIAHMEADPVTAMLVLRVIGIFVGPLGAILGYL